MSASSFGSRWVVTSFGESHGPALGAVIDGCPAGVPFDQALLERELARRRPGAREASGALVVSGRNEQDRPEILSGVYEGRTLGTPIAIMVRNQDARPRDYAGIAAAPRAGHADDVWRAKFGVSDPRGGGRSSGRETVSRVMGGAVARMFASSCCPDLRVRGFARRIGPIELPAVDEERAGSMEDFDRFVARFPSEERSGEVERLLTEAKLQGLSYGGIAEFRIARPPASLGQPVFHKLKADLAAAAMSVGATASFELGAGIDAALAEGSSFHSAASDPARYGGIRGGISTGETILFRVGFKPTSSVLDVARKGRHDPCIVPRAIPVIEAMIWLVLADHLLWARGDRA